MADRIVVMNHGVIEQIGTPMAIYREPASAFVADFIGTMNFLPGRVAGPDRVDVAAIPIRVGARLNGLAAGAQVTLAVRPEDLQVRTAAGDAPNTFGARVESIEFLGSFVRADLALDGLSEQRCCADLPIERMRLEEIGLGQTLSVTLPAERLHVFPAAGHG